MKKILLVMPKGFNLFKLNSRGEVATTLTIFSFLLLVAGTILGSFVAQQETKTRSKATDLRIQKLAGYHWDECLPGACISDFDGRSDDNSWCQGYKLRCARKNGKVCQLPDPWCDGADQGPASTCIGVHQKGSDASQICSSAGKSCGDGRCDGPNENWETCNAPECPYTLPQSGGPPKPTVSLPPGTYETQCSDEGGICVQTTGVCQAAYGTVDGDKGCSAKSQYTPICCKIPPSRTAIATAVKITNPANFVKGTILLIKYVDNIPYILETKYFLPEELNNGIFRYTFANLDSSITSYQVSAYANYKEGEQTKTIGPKSVDKCESGSTNTYNNSCNNITLPGRAEFTIDIPQETTQDTVTVNITVTTNQDHPYNKIEVYGCMDNSSECNSVINTLTYNNTTESKTYTFTIPNLSKNQKYYTKGKIYYQSNGENKELSTSIQEVTTIPAFVIIDFDLTQSDPTASVIVFMASYTNADFEKARKCASSGVCNALIISSWLAQATRNPGIQIRSCDPLKGECDIPF